MDCVPICFIEEVLLQLEENQFYLICKFSSIWGEITDKELSRGRAYLHLYIESKGKAYFCVDDAHQKSVELDRIGQFVITYIDVEDVDGQEDEEDWNWLLSKLHPLTKKNFQLLLNFIRKPFPCYLALDFQTDPIHPLVQRLCLDLPRIAELVLLSQGSLSMDILTRSIERGTLSNLFCYINVTQKVLPALFKFVAFEKMEELYVDHSDDCPVSYETLLNGIIDAVQSRKRGCRISVDERYRHLCARLEEETARQKVTVRYYHNSIRNQLSVKSKK
uniref:F-box domain-containing protein n=1 Tax=Steinernema glaseri TaxID=37863 RepID=A0A1I8AEF7_9BILA